MTVLFCGSKLQDFGQGSYYTTTTATFFDNTYQPDAIAANMNLLAELVIPQPLTVIDDLWIHFRLFHNHPGGSGGGATGKILSVYDSANRLLGIIDVVMGSSVANSFASANGDSVVNGVGVFSMTLASAVIHTIDVRVAVTSSTITFDYYVNGVLYSTATAANTVGNKGKPARVVLDCDNIQMSQGNDNGISEVILTDNENTIGWRMATLNPDGAGFHTAWGGDWNSLLNPTDGRFLVTDTTGLRESWTLSNYAGPVTPASIRGVFVKLFGDKGTAGPQTYEAFLRIGGVDYDAAAQAPVPGRANMFEWALDPSTGLAWNTTSFNALEAGVRSDT